MREPRAVLFFAVAIAGLAYVAWRGTGSDAADAGDASLLETVALVGGVFLALHVLRRLIVRRLPPRDDSE